MQCIFWHYFLLLGLLFCNNLSVGSMQENASNDSLFIPYQIDQSSKDIFFIDALDRNNIKKLITRLGNWGVGRLLWHIKEMNRLGNRIRHVHPLCFLSYIYSEPELIQCMKLIEQSYFKKKEFITGLSEKMNIEAQNDNLLPYVREFSQKIGCKKWEDIFMLLDQHDWGGFLAYLNEIQLEKEQ